MSPCRYLDYSVIYSSILYGLQYINDLRETSRPLAECPILPPKLISLNNYVLNNYIAAAYFTPFYVCTTIY